jgi:hypothetical protein
MGIYRFSAIGNILQVRLTPISNDVNPRTYSFMEPSTRLVEKNTKLKMYESGKFVKSFLFSEIGTIASATPTSLEDANDKILVLIGALAPTTP